ncbi:D-cysteine desulfhydrase family protein [uncultured Roseobacter sp.]|uniref:D-cysteine desulfhydrase family protein n=1 Tax=uncultured Roseobacter sp. TaxID=114847 RepID=UPI00260BE549|nr:D-cysteine desulfhydrase family protein [uncultured Roseobacter sp.]
MHPRSTIVQQPTPLEHAGRLSDHLGIELWIKRDDLAGPCFGGNKARQLEYYFGAAVSAGADTVLITGAVQSNFVRLTAAVAAALGMQAIVQLEDRVPGKPEAYRTAGNVLLCEMLGAEIMTFPEGEDEEGADAALHERAKVLRSEGRTPYIIHLSEGHPPLGALGYVDCAREILDQDDGFDVFVVASGSGSTHSGLLAGLRGNGSKARVIGSCVRRPARDQTSRIRRIVARLADLWDGASGIVPDDIVLWDGALAPGYGQVGKPTADAMLLAAHYSGLILDPVYTAKSFAAVSALAATGDIRKGARVCYIHTGGLGAIGAYSDTIREALSHS